MLASFTVLFFPNSFLTFSLPVYVILLVVIHIDFLGIIQKVIVMDACQRSLGLVCQAKRESRSMSLSAHIECRPLFRTLSQCFESDKPTNVSMNRILFANTKTH